MALASPTTRLPLSDKHEVTPDPMCPGARRCASSAAKHLLAHVSRHSDRRILGPRRCGCTVVTLHVCAVSTPQSMSPRDSPRGSWSAVSCAVPAHMHMRGACLDRYVRCSWRLYRSSACVGMRSAARFGNTRSPARGARRLRSRSRLVSSRYRPGRSAVARVDHASTSVHGRYLRSRPCHSRVSGDVSCGVMTNLMCHVCEMIP